MIQNSIRKTRLAHMIVLSAFVGLTLFESLRVLVPMWEYILAFGVILAWMLGQRYERTVVVMAGLADVDDVIEAESRSWQWINWDSNRDDS